jgi:hypothetical protein
VRILPDRLACRRSVVLCVLLAGVALPDRGGGDVLWAQASNPAGPSPTTQPAEQGVTVKWTLPADDNFQWYINGTAEMAVDIENGKPAKAGGAVYNFAGKSKVPSNYTVEWTSNIGGFLETYAPTTSFIDFGIMEDLTVDLNLLATAVEIVPTAPATQPATKPATAPAAPEVPQKPLLPRGMFLPDELHKELALIYGIPDRDGRVKLLRDILAQRAKDPLAIVLELQIATLLGQNPDPKHHQEVEPEESLAVLRHICATYNHKDYYQPDPAGETCSPELMVPRAAIMAASVYGGLLQDRDRAKNYATVALDDLFWTYIQRTRDWLNAPAPAPLRPEFGGPMEEAKFQSRVAGWQERKRKAAAGEAIGPYEKELAEAAVRQYGLSFGPQSPAQVVPIMQQLIDRYPTSPIAVAAQGHVNACRQIMAASTQPGAATGP